MVPVSFPPDSGKPDSGAPLEFAGEELVLTKGNALYWPRERALLVADLHLEKGSWYAKSGQMLPPYDSRETLERIADAVKQTGARRVITLGDNFHDDEGTSRLDPYAAGMLEALTRALDWVWITGNHDEAMARSFGAHMTDEMELSGIILRHEAKRGESRPELSGHYHPKMRVRVRERHIARPCAVVSSREQAGAKKTERMILPAFGAYTGGMDAGSPEILEALSPAQEIDAVLPAKGKLVKFPLWRKGV
ncbi:ligase-associated DNA damage response endonuclease PdeM [uncultured Erythrobacter sp.]|uniref:ligase-associated DNA damage response endonuclease PdeM n=1 Tax=uncultured Erythrobacter sp. TaxID=263913 RepID=UPI0026246520|nr:ligase-associated DNA damage response endonuclease PdeM [uncultured Erythrobacter sp.]